MTHKIKLATVCQQIRGVSYTPKDMAEIPTEGYIPILRANNIQEKLVFNELVYVNANKISEIQLLKGGDIVVCASSGSKNLVGKAARFVSSPVEQVSFGAFCKVVRPRNIDASYLSHFFNSSYYRNTISKIAQGASINNIRNEHLDNLDINVPTPSEQKRLAERLDKVQELIAKQKEQIAKLDLLIKSRFLDMFGDPISNPKNWVMKKLKECARTNLSYGSGAKAINYNGTVRYIRITDIDNKGLLNKEKKSPSIFEEKYLLHQGDLLFARTGATVGKTFLYDKKYGMSVYAGYLIRFVPKIDLCHPLFVFYFTHTDYYKQFVLDKQKAVAQPNINAQEYGELLIPLPPLSLQTQFANFVKSVEQQKEVFSARLSHLEVLYKSLMQEYFG